MAVNPKRSRAHPAPARGQREEDGRGSRSPKCGSLLISPCPGQALALLSSLQEPEGQGAGVGPSLGLDGGELRGCPLAVVRGASSPFSLARVLRTSIV